MRHSLLLAVFPLFLFFHFERTFLCDKFCFLFLSFPLSAQNDKIPLFKIPDWAQAQIDETLERIKAWQGDDVTVVFLLISDIHSGWMNFGKEVNFQDTKYHIAVLLRASIQMKADFVGELGDIGFDRDTKWVATSLEHAEKKLNAQIALYRDFPLPVLFCMGNHDDGTANGFSRSEKKLLPKDYGEMFNGLTCAKGFRLIRSPAGDYGYFDVPGKKYRVFFMNTSEEGRAGYSESQLQFLADNLKMPEDFCAVVLQHISLHQTISPWLPSTVSRMKNDTVCIALLEDFVRGAKGEMNGVKWDFTQNQNTALAGTISGDSHFDVQAFENGVNYVITQSYGTIQPKNLPPFARYQRFDRRQNLLCDVVVIKPEKREMKFFRIGIGGKEFDREFSF